MVGTRAQTGTIELAPGVFAFIQEGGATNAGFIVGDDGALVIDALMTRALAKQLIGEVKRVTPKPVRFLVYTHFHGDHTFGGELFLPAAIVGHRECRDELIDKWEASVKRFCTNRPEFADEFRKVKPAPPEAVFTERMTLHLGQRQIELIYFGRAHTRGDIFIHLPQDRVLFSGDAVVNGRAPAAMDGYISSWIAVLERAQGLDVETLVPGHGLIGGKGTIAEQMAFFSELKRQVRAGFDAGKSVEQTAKDLKLPQFAAWPNISNLDNHIRRLYMEFRGEL